MQLPARSAHDRPRRRMLPRSRVCCGFATFLVVVTACWTHAADLPLQRKDALWLERITYGLDTPTVERFAKVGKRAFLEDQLSGRSDVLPAPVQSQIDALAISRTPAVQMLADEVAAQERIKSMSDDDKRQAQKARNDLGNQYAYETMRRHLLRALYSPAQLKQQLDWFWLNHFSVFAQKRAVRWLAADYEERAIRPHVLGHFRDLVIATLTHPAMLQYLDNAQNAVGHANENYARELMELHTLGVDAGYSQTDVQELARVLTGVGVARPEAQARRPSRPALFVTDGLFAFYPARHDFGDKTLLGHRIRGRGFAEIDEAVDILVRQPACARFISRKLAEYFVDDEPPKKLVDAMADTFQRSDGDIARVLRTLFESREFEASLGGKFKDPMHYVVSSVRLAYDGKQIVNQRPLVNWLNGQGEMLFGHQTPNGYALAENAWASSGQLSRRFEIAHAIGSGNVNLFQPEDGSMANAAGFPNLSNRLYFDAIQPYLSKSTLAALDQAKSQQEWNTFLLSSPEFNYR